MAGRRTYKVAEIDMGKKRAKRLQHCKTKSMIAVFNKEEVTSGEKSGTNDLSFDGEAASLRCEFPAAAGTGTDAALLGLFVAEKGVTCSGRTKQSFR